MQKPTTTFRAHGDGEHIVIVTTFRGVTTETVAKNPTLLEAVTAAGKLEPQKVIDVRAIRAVPIRARVSKAAFEKARDAERATKKLEVDRIRAERKAKVELEAAEAAALDSTAPRG